MIDWDEMMRRATEASGYALTFESETANSYGMYRAAIARDEKGRRHAIVCEKSNIDGDFCWRITGIVREKSSRAKRGFAWSSFTGAATRNAVQVV